MNKRLKAAFLAMGATLLLALSATAQSKPAQSPQTKPDEEFFIISSIEPAKHQLLLKRPTEVTLLMRVDDRTIYLNEQGKPLQLSSLRAGDTVWILSKKEPDGVLLARRIRLGPMTLAELHRLYFTFPQK